MRIQRLEVRNFRSFLTFDLDFDGASLLLVGENAGGKTSLLTGIARALGRDLDFTSADFADPQVPVEIQVTLSDLDAAQRGVFGNYVDFGGGGPTLRLGVRAVWNARADEADVEHGYPRHAGSRSRRDERDAIPLLWLASGRDVGRMLQFGVPRNLIGKLMEGLPIQQGLLDAIAEIRQASDQLGNDAALNLFLTEARNGLAELLPAVTAQAYSMGISAVTPRDLLRQFELAVQYLGAPVALPRQSSGVAQLSIFVFAMKLAAADTGTILLIDEPEISLHPQSQRALMRALTKLNCQTLVATHSPNLLDRADPRRVIRLGHAPGGITATRPTGLSDADARRLARFTNPQTAEAFFARGVVLVEGMSDQLGLEALARRRGRNLDAEGVAIVPIGGAKTIGSFLGLFGPAGFSLRLAGLCDEAEQSDFAKGLENAGFGEQLSTADMERLGFFVCHGDLEDELIRAVGGQAVEAIVDAQGDLAEFRSFQQQQGYRGKPLEEQLRAFIGGRGRKIEYSPLLIEALDLAHVPAPLDGVLAHI